MQLGSFLEPLKLPASFDFDKGRARFPLSPWGNDEWGNCVKVGQTNQLVRLERLEQRRTLPINTEMVVEAYKQEVGRQFGKQPQQAGDPYDTGLYVLDNLRNWRSVGMPLDFTKAPGDARVYKTAAFGEIVPQDWEQIKASIYLLHGVQLGLWLPLGVRGNLTYWDYPEKNGNTIWVPGSWGGHLVYAKAYDGDDLEILTWGHKVKVSREFVAKYCDEAYAVVDNFDEWRRNRQVDVEGMLRYLRDIGASGIQ